MWSKPVCTSRKSASAERCLRPLGATIAMATPDRKTARYSNEGLLSHRSLRKDTQEGTVITRFCRSPGIADLLTAWLPQLHGVGMAAIAGPCTPRPAIAHPQPRPAPSAQGHAVQEGVPSPGRPRLRVTIFLLLRPQPLWRGQQLLPGHVGGEPHHATGRAAGRAACGVGRGLAPDRR